MRNYRIKVLFKKSTFIIKQLTHRQEDLGKLPSAPLPTALRSKLLKDGINVSFVFLLLELLIKLLEMKRNRLGASVQILGLLDSGSFPGLPDLRRFLLVSPGKNGDSPPFHLILPKLVGKSH